MGHEYATKAANEVRSAILSISDDQVDQLAGLVQVSRRVVCYGGGREGLALRGWTMRLYHAGVSASYLGDVTCPPVGPDDLVILSSGPGLGEITEAIAILAHQKGARTVLTTAAPGSALAELCDYAFVIAAQTMANDEHSGSLLPMGTSFETALLVAGDLIAAKVVKLRGESYEDMRARHANLE